MKLLRVNVGDDGETFFDHTDWPLEPGDMAPPSPAGYVVTPKFATDGIRIMHTPAGYVDQWHPVPQRMFVILLSGCLRLETTDGDHRIIETGGMFLNEDDRGKGHRMMEVDGGAYDMALIHMSKTESVRDASQSELFHKPRRRL